MNHRVARLFKILIVTVASIVFGVALPLIPLSRAQKTAPPPPPAKTATAVAVTTDPKALALLEKARDKMLAAKTVSAEVEITTEVANPRRGAASQYTQTRTISRLMKPNYVYVATQSFNATTASGPWKPDGTAFASASNGVTLWSVIMKTFWGDIKGSYRTQAATDLDVLEKATQAPINGFFTTTTSVRAQIDTLIEKKRLMKLSYAGQERWRGAKYDVVVMAQQGAAYAGKLYKHTKRFYIGADGFIRRISVLSEVYPLGGKPTALSEWRVVKMVVDAPMKPETFDYKPPKDAISQQEMEARRPKPLTAGMQAPDFSAVDKNGKTIKLSDYRGKIVVLDFWATWCGPCVASFPQTNATAKKMADQGVVTLAVNVWDKKDAFDAWVQENQKKYDGITFVFDPSEGGQAIATPLYGVSGIPTQYLIDRKGVIRPSFIGFAYPESNPENAIAAADKPMLVPADAIAVADKPMSDASYERIGTPFSAGMIGIYGFVAGAIFCVAVYARSKRK